MESKCYQMDEISMDLNGYGWEQNKERKAAQWAVSPYFFRIKRMTDLLLGGVILVLVFPWLLPVLCLLVILDSGFPVFFVQERVGLNGKIFKCYKLRSMRPAPATDILETSRLGRFLRNSKLDELPQVINVLVGDMSFVGPRPHMLSDHEHFMRAVGAQYHLRHRVKPGITGLAQVSGYEGRINTLHKLRGRVKLDLFYIDNWSPAMEAFIIFKTIRHIFRGIWR